MQFQILTVKISQTTERTTDESSMSSDKDNSSIDHSLVIARAIGKTTEARKASILSKERKIKISIVISHCGSPVDWIPSFMGEGNYQVSEVTVISKCGKEVDGVNSLETSFGANINIKRLPNVGRCDHSYAHWIVNNFARVEKEIRTLSKDDVREDLIFFIKDNKYRIDTYTPFPDVLATAIDAGFGCVQKIATTHSHLPLELHYKPFIENFSIPGYARVARDDNFIFKSNFNNLGEWSDAIGLIFPDSEYINVCYGGNFLVQKGGILSQSLDAWTNMELSLSRGDNIQEGHFAERAWASIVAPPPSDFPWDVLSREVKPFVTKLANNKIADHGRLYISKYSPFWVVSAPTQAPTRIPVFYNVFTLSDNVEYVKTIVKEQMGMALPQHEFLVRSIGTPLTIPNASLLRHDEVGDEVETLELLWQHCNEHPSDKVVYIHSKGSFHYSKDNDKLRRFLTRGALSDECAQLPGMCNVCSSRMSPMPHPHTSGNMWLARCDYVKKLPQPSMFADMMSRHMEEMHVVSRGCWPCLGLHRFAAEHWIHSHPAVKPCDLSADESFVWGYKNTPDVDFEIDLKPAPRFELDVYGGPAPCMFGQYQNYRLKEYRFLYGEDVEIPKDWFGYRLLKENSSPLRAPLAPDAICRLKRPDGDHDDARSS